MSFTNRQQSPSAPNRLPNERRERHSLAAITVPDLPAFERAGAVPHPSGPARPTPAAATPALAQVVHLAATGIWVVKRCGHVTEINGRSHWCSRNDLTADAERAGIALSDLIVRTGAHG